MQQDVTKPSVTAPLIFEAECVPTTVVSRALRLYMPPYRGLRCGATNLVLIKDQLNQSRLQGTGLIWQKMHE